MPMTMEQFIAHLNNAATTALPEALRHVANQIGKDAVRKSKAKLGTEGQEGIGPYNTWDDLADSTYAEKARLNLPSPSILRRTSDLADSISFNVDASMSGFNLELYSTSEYAHVHELGSDHVPPRPFMGPVFYENQQEYMEYLKNACIAAIMPAESTFLRGGIGAALEGALDMGGRLSSAQPLWKAARKAAGGTWQSVRGRR